MPKTCREVTRRLFCEKCSRDSIIEPMVINLKDSDIDSEEQPE
jgi:hypothetical protein